MFVIASTFDAYSLVYILQQAASARGRDLHNDPIQLPDLVKFIFDIQKGRAFHCQRSASVWFVQVT